MPSLVRLRFFVDVVLKKKKRAVLHNLVSHCSVFVYFKFMRVVRKSQATSITSPISRKKDRRSHFVGSRDIMVTPNYTPPSVPTRVVKTQYLGTSMTATVSGFNSILTLANGYLGKIQQKKT